MRQIKIAAAAAAAVSSSTSGGGGGGGEGAGSGKKQGNPPISRSLSLSDRLVYLSGGKKFGCMHA